jgi:ABC-type transport system involved in multi-copper enzyme maturation permease subunit
VIPQLRSELLKLRTTRTSRTLLLWMLVLVVLVVLLHSFALSGATLRVATNQPKVFGWGTSIGAMFAALLGALSITSEIRSGTIRPTLLATPNRTLVIAAKVIATAIGGVLIGLIAEGLVAATASSAFAVRGIPVAITASGYAQMLAGGAAAAALWAAIGTGIGAIVRNQIGAVAGLCVWLLLVETVLIGEAPSFGKFTPGSAAGALVGMLQSAGSSKLLAPGVGAALLVLYAVVAAGAGALATERRDLG